MKRSLVVVDGEHSTRAVALALRRLRSNDLEPVGLFFLGGSEKATPEDFAELLPVREAPHPLSVPALRDALAAAIDELSPQLVVDLSDSPVQTRSLRETLAAVAAWKSVAYEGPGYRFEPPSLPRVAELPTVSVVGTDKRTGKTTVCAELALELARSGHSPIVVTMGRGGPESPVYIPPGKLSAEPLELLRLVDDGLHAASDYVEDAVFTRLPTVGAWRCGGGVLGECGPSSVPEAVRLANTEAERIGADVIVLEGSGSAIPPVASDTYVVVCPWEAAKRGSTPQERGDRRIERRKLIEFEEARGWAPEVFEGLGYYRLLVADAVVVTGVPTSVSAADLDATESVLSRLARPHARIVFCAYRPEIDADLAGKKVAIATTAPEESLPDIAAALEAHAGVRVVASTASLSDPQRLSRELDSILASADVLVTELKGRAVDVAARAALERGKAVAFCRLVPVPCRPSPSFAQMAEFLADLWSRRRSPVEQKS